MSKKQEALQAHAQEFLKALEADPQVAGGMDELREGLHETPKRWAKAMDFWTSGYHQNPAEVLKVFQDGSENYDGMLFQGNIPVYSMCEHHMAPFFGVAHIAYIPGEEGGVVGLSKLSRLTDIFARRLQVQERLTRQVAEALEENLSPLGVAVTMQCRHMCMESRGVQRCGTVTTTTKLIGEFLEDGAVRAEYYQLVAAAKEV